MQWWPKVKPNGLVTGHDFITAAGVRQVHPQEDWALCANGTRHEGAVEGAVRDFAQLVSELRVLGAWLCHAMPCRSGREVVGVRNASLSGSRPRLQHGLTVAVTYAEDHPWRSWMIRKPARC